MSDIRDCLVALEEAIEDEKFMNDERERHMMCLVEIMHNIMLEEEITRGVFQDIRGGSAI